MRINTNILSLSAQRNLATTTRALARAMEKLASGSRINSARDDAAGLAISSGLEAQRRGMLQAIRNMNDAQNTLLTANGSLQEQINIVQRLRELSVQSANGILNSTDRSYLNNEFTQLREELLRQRTSESTSSRIQLSGNKNDTLKISVNSTDLDDYLSEQLTSSVGLGTFNQRTTFSFVGLEVLVSDLDNDGYKDLFFAHNAAAVNELVYLSAPGGISTPTLASDLGRIYSPKLADINNDGLQDLVSQDQPGNLLVRFGNGNGTFGTNQTVGSTGTNGLIATGDMNADGNQDLLVANSSNDIFYLYTGNGNGTFSTVSTFSAGFDISFEFKVSFSRGNNDAYSDIFVANATTGDMHVFLNNGSGVFSTPLTSTGMAIAAGSRGIAADINGDQLDDIIVGSAGSDSFQIFLGLGDGTFGSMLTQYSMGNNPQFPNVEDFNGDGIVDFLTGSATDGTMSYRLGAGDGTFGSRQFITTGGGLFGRPFAGDFNQDGVNDVSVVDGTLGSVYYQDISSSVSTNYFDISSQSSAEDTIEKLDSILGILFNESANIGAQFNRLDYAKSNALITVENIASAQSQISDTDYASELAEFTRLQILQEAGIAVLSKANISSKLALSLLSNI